MKLYIVTPQISEASAVVVDRETGFKVAEFFSQDGRYDSIALANEFIYAIRGVTKSVTQEIGNVGPGASVIGAKFDSL